MSSYRNYDVFGYQDDFGNDYRGWSSNASVAAWYVSAHCYGGYAHWDGYWVFEV